MTNPQPAVRVEIKPLEWREYEHEGDPDRWDGETIFGTFYGIRLAPRGYQLEHDYRHMGLFGTLDEAKAAAQARRR